MSPEDVLREYAASGVKLKVEDLGSDVLIEGTREALIFLSKLLSAQAETSDDGFSLSPRGAGSSWFSNGSTKGIYLHRVNEEP